MDPDHIWYLLATGDPCKPHENALKQYRNPQYYTWNASGDHILGIIFIELFHIEMLQIWTQSVYGHLKRCAHIASTVQNDGQDPRSKRGAGEHPIRKICVEFICICSTSATGNGGKLSIAQIIGSIPP